MKRLLNNNIIRIVAMFLVIVLLVSGISIMFKKPNSSESSSVVLETPTVKIELTAKNGYISFLGDSITTYDGWSNNASYNSTIGNNGVYYTSSKMPVYKTYWHRVASALGMGLCVNNSWDGARVTDTKEGIPDGKTRAAQLHNDVQGIFPDVIIVNLGTNDIANGIDYRTVIEAYSDMLTVIKQNYPNADVYCCGLLQESRNDDHGDKEKNLTWFNDALYELCIEQECYFIYNSLPLLNWDYKTDTIVDSNGLRVHPNTTGMEKLAQAILKFMRGK